MLYNISNEVFADHVRQVNTWKDLAIRCGCETVGDGKIKNKWYIPALQKKAINMNLNLDHFHRRFEFPDDDVFIKMVEESDGYHDIVNKCVSTSGRKRNRGYFNRRIKDLCIDTSHWKITSIQTRNKPSKSISMNVIDDETFKTILKNSINWKDLYHKCGYISSTSKDVVIERIEMLGLDTNHLDRKGVDNEKIFVVESQYRDMSNIKKRLVRDFNRLYECSKCKNVNFTTRDGVLMWNDQEITLQLEHKNGINNDNRLDN